MASRRPNPRLVKIYRPYNVSEIAELFGIHRNTVRNWFRVGLMAIDNKRPTLVKGAELRRFIEARRATGSRPCQPGQLYCLRCRGPQKPVTSSLMFLPSPPGAGNLRGRCSVCGTKMFRRTRLSDLARIFPDVHEALQQAEPRLSSSCNAPVNCDINQGENHHA